MADVTQTAAADVTQKAADVTQKAAEKVQEATEKAGDIGRGYVAEPAKTVMQRVRGMSYRKWAALLVGVGALLAVGTTLLVVLGLPVLFIGGCALLLLSPVILVTAPLWIPVVLFFITITGFFVAVVGTTFGGVVALWWLYRYFRTPLPPGGQQVYQLKESVKDSIQKTAKFITNKCNDLKQAFSG